MKQFQAPDIKGVVNKIVAWQVKKDAASLMHLEFEL